MAPDSRNGENIDEVYMTLYVAIGLDVPNSGPLRDNNRAAHRAYVKGNDSSIRLVGKILDDEKNQCGAMYLFEADSAASVRDWFSKEPFYRAGAYREFLVHEYFVGKSTLPLQDYSS